MISRHLPSPLSTSLKSSCRIPLAKENYGFLLDASIRNKSLPEGKQIHAQLLITGHHRNDILAGKIVIMYATCGFLQEARRAFDSANISSSFAYNMLIRGYVYKGLFREALNLFQRMQHNCIPPDEFTFPFVAKACAELQAEKEALRSYSDVKRFSLESNPFVANSLVFMFGKCGRPDLARQVFDELPNKTLVSWNSLIAAYVHNDLRDKTLSVFRLMRSKKILPDSATIVSLLPACGEIEGKVIHGCVIKYGLNTDTALGNALINTYGKLGLVKEARQVFDEMSTSDVISWTAMICGYSRNGLDEQALELYGEMQMKVKPNSFTMVSLLPVSARLRAAHFGRSIHGFVFKTGFQLDVVVGTALIDWYSRFGDMETATYLFKAMPHNNVASWNSVIGGCCQNGLYLEALANFKQMDVIPNRFSLINVLPACARLSALQYGASIHGFSLRSGCPSDVSVSTALIDMYAKSGSLKSALCIFERMSNKDRVSWSTMIAAYGVHGYGTSALGLFSEMISAGFRPNAMTFTSILYACSHSGLVNEGLKVFKSMKQEYDITPGLDHYACVVDLLGRDGKLTEAKEFIEGMPLQPTAEIWGTLLAACKTHYNVEIAECAASHLSFMEAENPTHYAVMSNIYAAAGNCESVQRIRKVMQGKKLGMDFSAAGTSNPSAEEIYAMM